MARVLFVTKDSASRPMVELARALSARGVEIHIVCEGLSSALWFRAGFQPRFVGTQDIQFEPFTLDAKSMVKRLRPALVIVGESDPIHLEEAFGQAANACGVPLAFYDDFWNGFKRNKSKPELVLTIDAYAAELVRAWYPSMRVEVVGSGQVRAIRSPHTAEPERISAYKERYGSAVLFVGGETTDDVKLVAACMERTRGFLVPRFHPKHRGRLLGKQTLEDGWREVLSSLGDRVVWLDDHPLESLIDHADIVCSGTSTVLISSVQAGKVTIVLDTPEVAALLLRVVGLVLMPLVPLGAAYAIRFPVNLGEYLCRGPRDIGVVAPFDPEKALRAIEGYL